MTTPHPRRFSPESCILYRTLVKNHMDTTRFGMKEPKGSLFCPNSPQYPYPVYINEKAGWKKLKLSKRFIERHLRRGDGFRLYFENRAEADLHPLVIDIDGDIDGQDPQAALELAASIQLWFFDHGVTTPMLVLRSPGGTGAHLWIMFRRGKGLSPQKFNQMIERLGRVLRQQFAQQSSPDAHLCNSGYPIKGTLTWSEPNPAFDERLAREEGCWRRIRPDEGHWMIVPGMGRWEEPPSASYLEQITDPDRIDITEHGPTVLMGPVQMDREETYQWSKSRPGRDQNMDSTRSRIPFRVRPELERETDHRGSLIAFPCCGAPERVAEFEAWYEEACRAPFRQKDLIRLARMAPAKPECGKRAMATNLARPGVGPAAGGNGTAGHLGHPGFLSPATPAAPPLRATDRKGRSFQLLTGEDKCSATMGAAQIALRQLGDTNIAAVQDLALRLYESYGPATGERTAKRVERCNSAVEKALWHYVPLAGPDHGSDARLPGFDQAEIDRLAILAAQAWPHLDDLKAHLPPGSSARRRRLTHEMIAKVFCLFAKYSLTNADGQISAQCILKSMPGLHRDQLAIVKRVLIQARWLSETDSRYCWFTGQRRAKCYQIGPRAPHLPWCAALAQALESQDRQAAGALGAARPDDHHHEEQERPIHRPWAGSLIVPGADWQPHQMPFHLPVAGEEVLHKPASDRPGLMPTEPVSGIEISTVAFRLDADGGQVKIHAGAAALWLGGQELAGASPGPSNPTNESVYVPQQNRVIRTASVATRLNPADLIELEAPPPSPSPIIRAAATPRPDAPAHGHASSSFADAGPSPGSHEVLSREPNAPPGKLR